MPKPFDATLKTLLEAAPRDWTALVGYPVDVAEVIDADVSTVSAAADKVLRVPGPPAWIMHLEFQAGPDARLPRRLHGYNALLEDRHDLPVRSAVILLRPQADLANLTGVYEQRLPDEAPYLTFRYAVIRVWQLPVEKVLAGGVATLPLAPISAVAPAELPALIERMKERLEGPHQTREFWTAAYVLMGLRYPAALIDELLRGVLAMEESVTYQAILSKGRLQGEREGRVKGALQEARKTLLLLGSERFGAPDAAVTTAIEALDDLTQLEQLSVRILHAEGWQELLSPPRSSTRRRTPSRGRKGKGRSSS